MDWKLLLLSFHMVAGTLPDNPPGRLELKLPPSTNQPNTLKLPQTTNQPNTLKLPPSTNQPDTELKLPPPTNQSNTLKLPPPTNQPDTCGCTTETLPHPRIVLLGPTGVGKSTFGNRLFGITEENEEEALCSQLGQHRPYKFGVGHRSESHTVETSWLVGHYLGDPNNPCITIIDSPGTGDTEGRDCDHGIALAKGIKEIGSIDAFMLLFKGTNPRFSQSMQEQIDLYTNIFGADLFKNAITEFTYWSHDRRSVRDRKRNRGGLDEDIQHKTWNREYAERLGVPRIIPTVFIDPVYDEEYAYEEEVEKNKEYTDKLWKLITNDFTEFKCDKRCKAPSGFFSGQPWLFEDNTIQDKRLEDRASITWQIWFAGCDGTGTKSYKIYHKTIKGKLKVIYELVIDEDDKETINATNLLKSMNVTDEPADKYKTIRVTIDSVDEVHFGEYYVENDKGNSVISKMNKIIDGEWAEWGDFGDCNKTCIWGDEAPGSMNRVRDCKPPHNGGMECKGSNNQTKACAHRHGENADMFRQCPVDATWSNWAYDWSKCSANCIKEGGTVPQKTRSRVCQPERFGGKTCAQLEGEAKKENLLLYTEIQNCTSLPECPKPASLGPWTEWSTCSSTCYPEGGTAPQSTRKRTCKEASLSTSDELNADILTCKALGEMEAYKPCNISACPVSAEWQLWGEWTSCSTSCEKGSRHRRRSYTAGRNGAEPKPTGDHNEKEDCNAKKKCPVKATWTWGSWSSCDLDCYKPDGYRGKRTKDRICTEGSPQHDIHNCDNPPPPGRKLTEMTCPFLPKCFPLTRVWAKISDGYEHGTDSDVYMQLRYRDSGDFCETSWLTSSGNSWSRGSEENFRGSKLDLCKNFFPREDYTLEFNFVLKNCDAMKISRVWLEFGKDIYDTTTGLGWYNCGSNGWVPIYKKTN